MGIFAVLRKTDTDFDVVQCHLNLWALSGLFGRRTFYFDVGLRLKAGESGPLSTFDVAFPFEPAIKQSSSLHTAMRRPKNLNLIFGRQVSSEQHNDHFYIDYDSAKGEVEVIAVSKIAASKSVTSEGSTMTRNLTLTSITLAHPIEPNEEGYVRFRLPITKFGRAWTWKRSWPWTTGAIVDLRIADVREVLHSIDIEKIIGMVTPIPELYVFVIAPVDLQLRTSFPNLKYMRLLEGRDWEPYLGRAISLVNPSAKMVIYQWRAGDGSEPVCPVAPFRGYLDLDYGAGSGRLLQQSYATVLTLVLLLMFFYWGQLLPEPAEIEAWGQRALGAVLTVGLLTLVGKAVTTAQVLRPYISAIRNGFLLAERWVYAKTKSEDQ